MHYHTSYSNPFAKVAHSYSYGHNLHYHNQVASYYDPYGQTTSYKHGYHYHSSYFNPYMGHSHVSAPYSYIMHYHNSYSFHHLYNNLTNLEAQFDANMYEQPEISGKYLGLIGAVAGSIALYTGFKYRQAKNKRTTDSFQKESAI